MNNINEVNENKSFMKSSFGDSKADKSKELNSSMSITSTANDELTNKLQGGLTNGR